MPEHLLSARTVHGWLSLLAAMTVLSRPDEDVRALISTCPLPVGLLDLSGPSLLTMSGRLSDLLGLTGATHGPIDITGMSDRPGTMEALFDLLKTGAIDMYAATRSLVRPHAGALPAENWVIVADTERRERALWMVLPLGEPPAASWIPERRHDQWPQQVAGLVVGSFDPALRIGRISVDVQKVLGHPVNSLRGRPLTDLIHPEDLPELFSTMGACLADRAGVGTRLRVASRAGDWVPTRWIVSPVIDGSLRFGFAFTTSRSDQSGAHLDDKSRRVAALERHLWRIAEEVQTSGVVSGLTPVPEPGQVPGLGDLSPRQWEVLTRLLRGERVPAIARDLYLSQSTVRNHLTDMFRKLGVNSQQALLELFRVEPRRRARQR